MNHIFGCPMHYGVGAPGLINSLDYLQSFCPELDIHILPEITRPEENLSNLKHLNSVIASCSQIAESGYHALCKGESPLYITGDHSSAIGSVSAAGTYCEDLGLIWIDAHPDINTDKTTVTGNIHGNRWQLLVSNAVSMKHFNICLICRMSISALILM